MIPRILENKLKQLFAFFPIVSVTGPRQSGKTTLVKAAFPNLPYVSLENMDDRQFAIEDPRGFLKNYPKGAIFDEVQRTPDIFSYLQSIVDENQDVKYVLTGSQKTGSQNFLLSHHITQSLAGRVGILKLLPFSIQELSQANLLQNDCDNLSYSGFFPRIYDKKIPPQDFFSNYIQTYIERDVRQLSQVGNLHTFSLFLKLCAGRVGQLLNLSNLANDVGVSVNTIKSWINILEASYVVFRLYPHHKNFNKRLTKMPKLYFYDTGLLCYLLGLKNAGDLQVHFAKGQIFENFVILDLLKQRYNRGQDSNIYFWRDHKGNEVDLIVQFGNQLIPIEIKAGKTKKGDYFNGLNYWRKLSDTPPNRSYVIYAGDEDFKTSDGLLISWKSLAFTDFSDEK